SWTRLFFYRARRSCRCRGAAAWRSGASACSPPWRATRAASPISSTFPPTAPSSSARASKSSLLPPPGGSRPRFRSADGAAGPDRLRASPSAASCRCAGNEYARYARVPIPRAAAAEGLGDIVVRAGVERFDLRALLCARREDQDRHRRPGANAPDHLHAVDVGQAEVDDRQIGLVAAGVDGAARAGVGLDHAVAFGGERGAQEPADLRLVLDDEDLPSGFGHSSRGTCGAGSTGRVKRNAA